MLKTTQKQEAPSKPKKDYSGQALLGTEDRLTVGELGLGPCHSCGELLAFFDELACNGFVSQFQNGLEAFRVALVVFEYSRHTGCISD